MIKGDIVLVPFPYTDLTGSKIRPALVLLNDELDIVCAFITSQTDWQEENDLLITPSISNGLKKTSLIRLGKLATLDKNIVWGKMGELTANEKLDLDKKLMTLFQLNS